MINNNNNHNKPNAVSVIVRSATKGETMRLQYIINNKFGQGMGIP